MGLRRVAGARIETDQVIAERRGHGTGQLPGLQRIERRLELGDEAALRALAEVTAVRAGDGVRRLTLRYVLELRSARDLHPQLVDAVAHRRAVGGGDPPRNGEHADRRSARALELRLVSVV